MLRFLASALILAAAAPALADPPADATADATPAPAPQKMKKVCHAEVGSNPLWTQTKCHMVPVETAAAPHQPAGTQMAARTTPSPQ